MAATAAASIGAAGQLLKLAKDVKNTEDNAILNLKQLRILKFVKCVLLVICMLCAAVLVNSGFTHSEWNYCLAAAIVCFIAEVVVIILSVTPLSKGWHESTRCGICMIVYHILMFLFVFAACVCLVMAGASTIGTATISGSGNTTSPVSVGVGYRIAAQGYNAFGIFIIIGFSLDILGNIIWIRGGVKKDPLYQLGRLSQISQKASPGLDSSTE